jgi:IS1 family transposase
MKYAEVNKLFIKEFPEFSESYSYFFNDNVVKEDEYQYTFYEGLVVTIIDILLGMRETTKGNELLKRLFAFAESMICSDDTDVTNLAYIAFFEYRDDVWLRKASHFMTSTLVNKLSGYIPVRGDDIPISNSASADDINDIYGIRIDLNKILFDYGIRNYEIPGITSIERYNQYKTINEAKIDNNSTLFLGRFGTARPYVICPISKVNCDENSLILLLEYLIQNDIKYVDDNKSTSMYLSYIPSGERIWNMDSPTSKHLRYSLEVWINPCFERIEHNVVEFLLSGRIDLLH